MGGVFFDIGHEWWVITGCGLQSALANIRTTGEKQKN